MDPATDDPYQVLGLTPSNNHNPNNNDYYAVDAKTVRAAYRRLALRHHPDKQTNPEARERAHAPFAKISHAYEVLTDPEQRQAWDEARQRQSSSSSHPPPRPHVHDPWAVFESVFRHEFGGGGTWADPQFGLRGRSLGGGLFGDSFFGGGSPFGNDPFLSGGRYGGAPRDPWADTFLGGGSPFFGGGGFNDMFSSMRQMQEQMRQQQSMHNNNHHYSTSYSTTSRTIQRDNGDRVTTTETTRMVNGQERTTHEIVTQRPDGTVVDRQFLDTTSGGVEPTAALPSSSRPRDDATTSATTSHPQSKRRRLPWRKSHEEEKKE